MKNNYYDADENDFDIDNIDSSSFLKNAMAEEDEDKAENDSGYLSDNKTGYEVRYKAKYEDENDFHAGTFKPREKGAGNYKHKHKHKHPVKRTVRIVILVLAALIIIANLAFDASYRKMDIDSNGFAKINAAYKVKHQPGVTNILLMGLDKNEDEQSSSSAARRTDSMMLVSINREKKKISICSFMRDMYLEVPGHGMEKLNAAYTHGGASLLAETIVSNYKVPVDGYAAVNFDCFVKIINAIHGINVNLTESEAVNLNNSNYISKKKFRNLKPGRNHLNGYQALGYCRIRHGTYENGRYPGVYTKDGKGDDYARTERQRTVIRKIINKMKRSSPVTLLRAMNVSAPYITTNITSPRLKGLTLTILLNRSMKMKTHQIPVVYTSGSAGGQFVLNVDVEADRKKLYSYIR
jgi:LCP family protein required for cell wall assembly